MEPSELTAERAKAASTVIAKLIDEVDQLPDKHGMEEAGKKLVGVKQRYDSVATEARQVAAEVDTDDAKAAEDVKEAARTVSKDAEAAHKELAEAQDLIRRAVGGEGPGNDVLESISATSVAAADVTNAATATRTEAVKAPALRKPRTIRFARRLLVALGALYAVLFLTVVWNDSNGSKTSGGIALAIALTILGLGLIAVYWSGPGSFDPILKGADKRYSTSQAQMVAWTLVAVTIIGFLAMSVALEEDFSIKQAGLTTNQVDDYLILIGGPFAAAILGALFTATRVQSGEVQKTTATSSNPVQIVQDDGGTTSIVDAQYLFFNLVAIAFVILAFTRSRTLPDIPPVLLGLAGVSAATYTSNKVVSRNAPTIGSLVPLTVRPGDHMTVSGANFRPSTGLESTRLGVMLSGVPGELTPLVSDDRQVTIRVPIGLRPGTYEVRVRSAGTVSNSDKLTIVPDSPVLAGVTGPDPRRGGPMTLIGRDLLPPGPETAWSRQVSVLVDGEKIPDDAIITGEPGRDQKVQVDLPPTVAPGSHEVIIRRQSVASDHIVIHVD